MTESGLSRASNSQLEILRTRFIQTWDKHFYKTGKECLGDLSKKSFLNRYGLLLKEMAKRLISPRMVSSLDKFVFDSAIFKFSAASLGDVVVIPDYCSIAGSYVRNPKEAGDVDIVIRTPEGQRDETLELKLGRTLAKVLHKDMEFIYHPSGPHSSYIPLFDLVLRAKDKMEIIRVKESVDVSKGLMPAQRKECDEETERIRENRKKAEWPHKFKPAKYTHPNGHPRCLICGDEEEAGGICHKPEDLEKGVRPAFGSSGGKKYLAKTIVGFIPEHKTYIEPFVGGGAVLFAKEPSEREIINDKDSEITFAYQFIKNMTEDDYKSLKAMDWVIKKSLFDKLKSHRPSNPRERFRKFIYVRTASYGKLGRNYDNYREGTDLAETFLTRLPIIKERLKNVQIFNKDYKELKTFDSRDSFFSFYYLDPPYPETETGAMGGEINMIELHKFCCELKGKFILSLNDNSKNRELFKDFEIKKVRTSQQIDVGGSWQHSRTELLISNFPLKKTDIYLAKEESADEEIEKGIRPAFGSPGGKRYLAKTIVGFIPEHKTYIEPFVGGGAVLFAKEPSENEIINDLDPGITSAYKFIKGVTEDDLSELRKKDWKLTNLKFLKLKEVTPANNIDKFHKFIMLRWGSFSSKSKKPNPLRLNQSWDGVNRLEQIKERFSKVRILNKDYKALKEFDSKDAFFYLDPPYPETANFEDLQIDINELKQFVDSLKGKFILSLPDNLKNRKLFVSYELKKVKTGKLIDEFKPTLTRTELLISNFPLKKTDIYLAKEESTDGVSGETDEEIEKGTRSAFGSPGGKRYLAKTIVSYIPEHKTYVEPFVGGGAVLFAKEPSEVEVINDINSEIMFAYSFLKKLEDKGMKELGNLNWNYNNLNFERLKALAPKDDVERFHKFLLTKVWSYAGMQETFARDDRRKNDYKDTLYKRLPDIKQRLGNVQLFNKDYRKIIERFNSQDSFFYLDPPYPGTKAVTEAEKHGVEKKDLLAQLRKIKGKFILSLNDNRENRIFFKEFNVVRTKSPQNWRSIPNQEFRAELLISNFPLKKTGIYLTKGEREYFEGLDDWDEMLMRDNLEVINSLAEGSVLDLGCGTGRLLKLLERSGRKVAGVDNSDIALGYCKERDLETKKADLEKDELPFEDSSFDNVISVHALEHLESPEKLLKDACRIAKKRIIILSPLGERMDPTHKQEFKELKDFKKCFGDEWKIRKIEESNSAIAVLNIEDLKKAALTPFGKFIPPKPTMAGLTEAFSVEEVWNWAKDKFPLDVEEKLNAFRFIMEKAGDKVRLKTEGNKDRTKQLAPLAEALKKIPDDFIIDCGMGIERDGKALPRIRLMTLMADKPELEEGDVIKATMFDLPYWKEDLHEKPLSERRKSLEVFFSKYLKSDPHFGLTSYNVVKDRKGLEQQFRKLAEFPQSEGILIKTLDGKWDTDGSCETWAKIKREAEIKVIVLERHEVKGGNYNYTCGLLPGDSGFENLTEFRGKEYINLGKCYNTKMKAEPGEILTMGVEEIIPQEKKLQWLGARVLDIDKDRKEPYFAKQAMDIAERANILQKARHKRTQCMRCSDPPDYEIIWANGIAHAWFCEKHFKEWINEEHDRRNFSDIDYVKEIKNGEAGKKFGDNPNPNIRDELKAKFAKIKEGGIDYVVGDAGRAVLQLHIMGIEEEKVEALKKASAEAVRSKHNPLRLKLLLKGAVGEQGCHIDLRMVRKGDDYFEGGEIMVGNLSGLDKLKKLEQGGKLRFGWKVPRKEEPEAETIRGPVEWMDAGKNRMEIFPPGEAGATANLHGAMLLLDSFTFEAVEPQDKHAKKLVFKGSKLIPEGTYLMAYVPVTEAGKKGERVWMISKLKEEEAEKQRQKLNSPTFAYEAVYGKLPEEPLAGRTDSPKKSWKGLEVDKHIKDGWLEQLNSIERIEIRSTDEGKSKERVAFVVFRMRDLREDNEAEAMSEKLDGMEGLHSLCDTGAAGRPRVVVAGKVIYGQSGWEEWWDGLAGKIKEVKFKKRDLLEREEIQVPIFKVSEEEHIVGGIVYEPMKEDVQGDYATEKEIRDACYYYMEHSKKFKLQHKGEQITQKINILENYIVPANFEVDKQKVKKGSWVLIIRVLDAGIWKDIKEGRVTGFSMAGLAHRRKVEKI